MPQLIDPQVELLDGDSTNPLVVKKTQEIPGSFLDGLASERLETANKRIGNFAHVASVPTVIHEKWLREGFDCTQAPIQETIARLKREDLGAFLATNKAF